MQGETVSLTGAARARAAGAAPVHESWLRPVRCVPADGPAVAAEPQRAPDARDHHHRNGRAECRTTPSTDSSTCFCRTRGKWLTLYGAQFTPSGRLRDAVGARSPPLRGEGQQAIEPLVRLALRDGPVLPWKAQPRSKAPAARVEPETGAPAAAARLDALHEFAARFTAPLSGVSTGPSTPRGTGARRVRGGRRRGAAAEGSGACHAALPGRRAAGAIRTSTSSSRRADLDAAEAALRGLGYANASSATGDRRHRRRCARAHVDTGYAGVDDQSMIDLHRWLPGAGRRRRSAWEALAARRTWIEIGGRRAAVLDRAGQAMHLAMHAAQHGPAYRTACSMSSRSRSSAGRPTSGTLPRSSPRRSTRPRHSRRAFACCQRVRRWRERLGLPSTAELDWKIRHRQRGHAERFTSRRSQTPTACANGCASCAAHCCRVERGSCTSIRGPGRADCVSSPPTQPIWRGRPAGPPARGDSGARAGARAGSADAARQGQ